MEPTPLWNSISGLQEFFQSNMSCFLAKQNLSKKNRKIRKFDLLNTSIALELNNKSKSIGF